MLPTKRRVFFSFHYAADNWRAAQVRNIGAVTGNRPVSANGWENVKRGGDAAVKRWIDSQMRGRSCTVVLVGRNTANRKWINYEIIKSWNENKGLLGIHIHGLADRRGRTSSKGRNPFDFITLGGWGQQLSSFVHCYDPDEFLSMDNYAAIAESLAGMIEAAILMRKVWRRQNLIPNSDLARAS